MKQITVSDETYAKLQTLGQSIRAEADAAAEHGQLIDALIAGFQQLQAQPAKLAALQAQVAAIKDDAVQAVAGELAALPAEG